MSRTTRRFCTEANYREARKGRSYETRRSGTRTAALIAAGFVETQHGVEYATLRRPLREVAAPWAPRMFGPSSVHGGMLMSPSNTGMWGDEYDRDARVKRSVKRSERQKIRREMLDTAASID